MENTGSKFNNCDMFVRKVLLVGSNAKRFWLLFTDGVVEVASK